ncbi:transcription termination factor MTERF8, chloroplastic-like [Bidens hawaiensis]|uniref:transcription termination factor MTERF8, chloroplastic-like n=1 Tax=Bidens hawaiensis TaxID=980011 RepID=UPI00404B492F
MTTTLFHRYLHTIPPPSSPSSPSKSTIITYLTTILNFPKSRAIWFFNRLSSPQTNPQAVISFLQSHNFKLTDIQSWVLKSPHILFSDVNKTLKPRLDFFQDLGLKDQDLCKFISKNPVYLTHRFDQRNNNNKNNNSSSSSNNNNNVNLIRTLRRCNWADIKDPVTRVSNNVEYLEKCGIVGAQLATVITRQPRLLIMGESELKVLVSKVMDFGFSMDSRMLVHAIYTVSCLSEETFERKVELFRSYGFTKGEFKIMFVKAPPLLRVSETKLRSGIEFFFNEVKFEKDVLVRRPNCLMLSLEERVIPRFRVVDIMMGKGILKRQPKFLNVLSMPEGKFLEKFIYKDGDYAEELLLAYKSGGSLLQNE